MATGTLNRFCRDTIAAIYKAAGGQDILADVSDLMALDKWNNFSQFRKRAALLDNKYQASGITSGIYEIPTGGDVGTGRWIIQQCQDVSSATLDLLGPDAERLADFRKSPWSIIQWSCSTPPGGLTGRIVAIQNRQQLENYRRNALRGCFVLTQCCYGDMLSLCSAAGAAGVIADIPIPNNPDAQSWTKFAWGSIALNAASCHLPGMVISANQGRKLRKKLADGQQLHARMNINVRSYSGYHDMNWAMLEGAGDPQQEIWAIAHSAEPGAIDNSSGVAVSLAAVRIIADLVRAGKIPPPLRSIRTLSGYECYSFFHYIENQRRFQTPLAGVCVDAVGSKPSVCGGRIQWHNTIPMSAGFVDLLGRRIITSSLRHAGKPYRLVKQPFVATLDTLAGDPKYGFPCPWINTHYQKTHHTYDAYHSSADTLELLSKNGLATCATAIAGYLYYLANADNTALIELAQLQTKDAASQLKNLTTNSKSLPAGSISPDLQAKYIRQRHHISTQRLRRWCWGSDSGEIARQMDKMQAQLAEIYPTSKRKISLGRVSRDLRERSLAVPIRKIPITPTVENTPQYFIDAMKSAKLCNWALYWADGNRNLAEITELISGEYNRKVELAKVVEFFEAHDRLGYVKLIPASEQISPAQIKKDLKQLGVKAGMNLMVHSSLKALGCVKGGADAVVQCLIDAVGQRGTVMVPTFNHMRVDVFNPATTPGVSGAIAEALRLRPDAVRSDHTTHAVAAVGAKAEQFCANHLASGLWTANSPLARLMDAGGYVLCLGVDQIYSTHYHLAEVAMGSCIDVKGADGKVVRSDSSVETVKTLAYRNGRCPSEAGEISQLLDKRRQRLKGRVAASESTLTLAADIYKARCDMLKKHCNNCKIMPTTR